MSARIEDVLAEHSPIGDVDGGNDIECDHVHCGVYRDGKAFAKHQAEMLRPILAEVLRTGFNDGYASARRFYERAEDSPAPVGLGDGGARPEAGGEASSPGVDRCPEYTDKGTPCQKGLDHGGGHWFMSDSQYACLKADHFDPANVLSMTPLVHLDVPCSRRGAS